MSHAHVRIGCVLSGCKQASASARLAATSRSRSRLLPLSRSRAFLRLHDHDRSPGGSGRSYRGDAAARRRSRLCGGKARDDGGRLACCGALLIKRLAHGAQCGEVASDCFGDSALELGSADGLKHDEQARCHAAEVETTFGRARERRLRARCGTNDALELAVAACGRLLFSSVSMCARFSTCAPRSHDRSCAATSSRPSKMRTLASEAMTTSVLRTRSCGTE
jgi:hypothetical protein